MPGAFVAAYPWDLIDEGVGDVLDRLHGEVGVTGVTVPVGVAPLVQLRIRSVDPRVFRTRGGLFFHPDEQLYNSTRCKPIVSTWLKTRRPLSRIADACAERALELRTAISAANTGRIAQRHPEMACKNLWGVESQTALCLANPDVQTYLGALVADLSRREGVSAVVVSDFAIGQLGSGGCDLTVSTPLGEAERALLAICFCESCQQQASAKGVDISQVQRSAQKMLQQSFDRGVAADEGFDAIVDNHKPFADLGRWRDDTLSALLSRLTEGCACDLLLARRPGGLQGLLHADMNQSAPAGLITDLESPQELSTLHNPSARRNELQLNASFATGTHAAELVKTLAKAAELGFSGVTIDNYALLPDSALTSVKQAIRFARRTASV